MGIGSRAWRPASDRIDRFGLLLRGEHDNYYKLGIRLRDEASRIRLQCRPTSVVRLHHSLDGLRSTVGVQGVRPFGGRH